MSDTTVFTDNKHRSRRIQIEHITETLGLVMVAQRRMADLFRLLGAIEQLDSQLIKKGQLDPELVETTEADAEQIRLITEHCRALGLKLADVRERRIEVMAALERNTPPVPEKKIEVLPPKPETPPATRPSDQQVPTKLFRGLRFDPAMIRLAERQVGRAEKSTQSPPSDLPNSR